jgi:sporulation protein YqfC
MKKMRRWVKQWMTERMELPADVMMDLPRITMVGHLHIYIENHRGVLRFSRDEMRLRLDDGQLLIRGSGFVIKTILPEEILLEGKIISVQYVFENETGRG